MQQRILIIHNYYQIPGGEDTVVANEIKLLEDNGHKVFLYSRNNLEIINFSIFQKLMLPCISIFNPITYKEVKRIIKDNCIDVVHVHNTLNLISPSVYYAALSCKVPVVQTVHNFRLLCPGATFYRDGYICEDCVKHGLGCAVKHNCYRGSKIQTLACVINTKIHRLTGIYGKINYICLTKFNKEKLLQLNLIKSDRVFIKPNFVESNAIPIPYDQRKNQFVFVGRLDKLKGIDILLEAWKLMSFDAAKLIICGTGPMNNWCKNYIEDNLLSNIEIQGFVPNSEVKKIIANSRALILPTQCYEGFPMTIVEAYSVGTPVIGSDIGNVGSLIEVGKTGFKFQSIESLVEAVKRFERYPFIVDTINQRKYSSDINYKIICSIYNSISG